MNRILLTLSLLLAAIIAQGQKPIELVKPAKPIKGATVLFDGKSTIGWVHRGSKSPFDWTLKHGEMEVKPGSGDILTEKEFGDFRLHVEFYVPNMPESFGQARGNSGVYMHGRYEVQVLDSYGLKSLDHDCGGIYEVSAPLVNACLPPDHWQAYDVVFRAPRFDSAKKLVEKPLITVYHNGILIQDNVSIDKNQTRSGLEGYPGPTGPIMLQDHGCKVKFRNIWIKPLSLKTAHTRFKLTK